MVIVTGNNAYSFTCILIAATSSGAGVSDEKIVY